MARSIPLKRLSGTVNEVRKRFTADDGRTGTVAFGHNNYGGQGITVISVTMDSGQIFHGRYKDRFDVHLVPYVNQPSKGDKPVKPKVRWKPKPVRGGKSGPPPRLRPDSEVTAKIAGAIVAEFGLKAEARFVVMYAMAISMGWGVMVTAETLGVSRGMVTLGNGKIEERREDAHFDDRLTKIERTLEKTGCRCPIDGGR